MARAQLAAQVIAAEGFFRALMDLDAPLVINQIGLNRCYEGWAVNPRIIPDHLIYMVAESALHGRVGSVRVRLEPGGMCWVMPGVLHEFWLDGAQPRPRIYHYKLSVCSRSGRQLRLAPDVVVANEASQLRRYCDDANREGMSQQPLSALRVRASLVSALSGLLQLSHPSRLGKTFDARQRACISELVERHPERRLSSAQLAKAVDLQEDYFTRVFRRTYGLPPRSWIVHSRMQLAATRLEASEQPVERIARDLGYASPFLFSRQFKQVFGKSPSAYRHDL